MPAQGGAPSDLRRLRHSAACGERSAPGGSSSRAVRSAAAAPARSPAAKRLILFKDKAGDGDRLGRAVPILSSHE